MNTPEQAEAVLALGLLAALSDGRSDSTEREQLRSLFDTLGSETDLPSLSQLHQQVVLGKISAEDMAARLESEEDRRTAFEIAVCVADADGKTSPKEQAFLDHLERLLRLDHDEAVRFERQAEAIATAPDPAKEERLDSAALLGDPVAASAPIAQPAAQTTAQPARRAVPAATTAATTAALSPEQAASKEVDAIILRYSVLNGALELLPQNLATMAILPLQTRMVYTIGKQNGHNLGAGHIKEFIATIGLGATSQMLENFARKALGKLVKKTLGKTASKMVKAATGPMMSFASTYAIGQVAKAYYSGGRTLAAVDLRQLFQQHLDRGRALYAEQKPRIESSARTLDPAKVLDMVRGKATA